MGFLDGANDLLNQKTAAVSQAVKSGALGSQLKELERQKDTAMSRLGAALYPMFRNSKEVREPNQALFDCIENIEAQIRSVQYDIDAINRQKMIVSSTGSVCPKCGQVVSSDSAFCPSCGNKIEATRAESAIGNSCPKCGSPLEEGQAFCMLCGHRIG